MISDHTIGLECDVRSSPGATKNVMHVISEDYPYEVDYHSHMPLCNIEKGIEERNIEEVIRGWIQQRDQIIELHLSKKESHSQKIVRMLNRA